MAPVRNFVAVQSCQLRHRQEKLTNLVDMIQQNPESERSAKLERAPGEK
ncbi:MAG TPA: hypothetical protein VK652_11315 [Steroidobacteraceae bacterium]|nr:hypothetical protein [Steroidobacteraceae bacterium]